MEPDAPTPFGPNELLHQVKEVKLQLPLRAHVNLHSLKLLRSQSIRDSVIAALDQYFNVHPIGPVGAPIPDDADPVQ